MTLRVAACSCGQLRATVSAEPLRVSICHCLACQRRTGSTFGTQARFAANAIATEGAHKTYVRIGDEGSRISFCFCPECGATVYYTGAGMEGFVVTPVGAFAEPGFPAPSVSVYEERMHAWVGLPQNIQHIA